MNVESSEVGASRVRIAMMGLLALAIMMPVTLPVPILRELVGERFAVSELATSLFMSINMIGAAIAAPIAGALADRIGRRKPLVIAALGVDALCFVAMFGWDARQLVGKSETSEQTLETDNVLVDELGVDTSLLDRVTDNRRRQRPRERLDRDTARLFFFFVVVRREMEGVDKAEAALAEERVVRERVNGNHRDGVVNGELDRGSTDVEGCGERPPAESRCDERLRSCGVARLHVGRR